jgi:hypothetical protein
MQTDASQQESKQSAKDRQQNLFSTVQRQFARYPVS